MKATLSTICILFLTTLTFAQQAADKPVTLPTKPAPASVIELTAEQTKAIKAEEAKTQLAATQLENLQLKLQLAQAELKKLEEALDKARGELTRTVTEAAKIPATKLGEYEISEKEGKYIFTPKKQKE